jgi:DNA-binding MarR family transcriptional regulator
LAATTPSELRHLVLAAQRHGNRILAGHLRKASLTPSQSEVLDVLADHAPLTLVELGRLLVCETGSPSRLVDTLAQRGLVIRESGQEDKRVVRLRLTPAGEQLLADGQASISAIDELITGRLSPDEMDQLAALLRKLLHGTPGGHAIEARFGPDRP